MNPIFWQIIVGIVLVVISAFVNLWIIHRERIIKVPEDVSILTVRIEAIEQLQRDVVKLREDVARIKGRINGHSWEGA